MSKSEPQITRIKNTDLAGAMQDEVGDAVEDLGGAIDLIQSVAGVVMGVDGCETRFFHAVQCGIGGFI